MQNKQVIYLAVAFQVLILIGVFVKALHPLLVGTPIRLKVEPRDPRDLLAGNHVILNYDFNQINLDYLENDIDKEKTFHHGDVLYLEMAPKGDLYETVGIWEEKPNKDEHVFMKAIVKSRSYNSYIRVNCGIEKYFAPFDKAKELEKYNSWMNRDSISIFTTVMVAPNGTARIKKIDYITSN